ncbi:MAG: biopolymer transporter ExbD [Candidatus Acidiferrum sp.]
MGITLGGGRVGAIAEMNVVPLIDILLVLLVIFMMIRPDVQAGFLVDLPQRAEVNTPAAPGEIVVQVFGDGTLRVNQGVVQWRDLHDRLVDIFNVRASRVAFVRGDGALDFGVIARAIDVMRGSGITTVGLMIPASQTRAK